MLPDTYAAKAVSILVRTLIWEQRKQLGLAAGKAPYGFKIVGPRGAKRLVPDELQRAWARKFILLRQHGFVDYRGKTVTRPSYRQLVLYLWHQNAVRPDGGGFSEGAVKRWVQGEMRLQAEEARQRAREASAAAVAQDASA